MARLSITSAPVPGVGKTVSLLGTWIALRCRARRIHSKCQSSMGTVTFEVCQAYAVGLNARSVVGLLQFNGDRTVTQLSSIASKMANQPWYPLTFSERGVEHCVIVFHPTKNVYF
ncbi:unnamed protein product [Pleuronectes platessa]|uniref:Uncharacterized protein n=1 Tax=Pleuronectes platessa TaxID=8262 RepID=A0A9N7YAD9_PLEPL|nr:unnamed protein product [Pleuronectes platessa]